MKWTKSDEAEAKPVVRALSFYKKSEDGDVTPVATNTVTTLSTTPPPPQENHRLSSKSFTSIDVKKYRRVSLAMRPPAATVLKSSSFSIKTDRPMTAGMTYSLGRPSNINKLVLRVPSIASEYEHKRVIHSVCVSPEAEESGIVLPETSANHVSSAVSSVTPVIQLTSVASADEESSPVLVHKRTESTSDLIPHTPKAKLKYRHRDLAKGQTISTISGLEPDRFADSDRWKSVASGPSPVPTNTSSEVGSTSLSNFSSGDGLSTPTQMGSTTRLIYGHKSPTKWRCNWSENISTALSILAFAGTFGNILRLPRMVYFHGGGIFLIVYVIITLVFGIPLTFLEIGLGQFCQQGTVKMWRAVNLLRGVGYAKILLSFITSVYYSIYVAVTISLFVWTAKGPLPFSECNSENATNTVLLSGEQCLKSTFLAPLTEKALGGVPIIFAFLLWLVIFFCILRKNSTSKQAMWLLFPACFALIIFLLVETSSATNSGIQQLFSLDVANLVDTQVWYFATVQMFFSMHIGFGSINTCAGRIYPKSNAFWTSCAIVLSNLLMGIAAVMITYALIDLKQSFSQFQIPELFVLTVIYNAASVEIVSRGCAVAAFLLVFVAGLCSIIALIYTIVVAVAIDTKKKCEWWHISGTVCFLGLILAILSIVPTDLSIPHVLDHYFSSRTVVLLTILELVGFAFIYGCSNIYNDFEFVIGQRLSSVWRTMWIVTPFYLLIIELCSVNLLPLTGEFNTSMKDNEWQFGFGWGLYFFIWLLILICALYQISMQVDYNLAQKFLSSIKPSMNWGPVDPIYRHWWVQWRNRYHLTGTRDFTLKRRGTRDYTHSIKKATGDSLNTSFDLGGVHPGDWSIYSKKPNNPHQLDYPAPDHICWRKSDIR